MKCSLYYPFFRNLANPVRIKIVEALREKEMSVNELVKKLKIEQSTLSHALSCLRDCYIVESHQEGKKRVYSLNKKTVLPILKLLDKHAVDSCKNKECKKCRL